MGKPNKRFSYLLLEEGEFYIQDWMATCRPGLAGGPQRMQLQPWHQRKLKGCLRLCSKSIFFEPDNLKAPIFMFPFNKIKKIEGLSEPLMSPSPVNSKWSKLQEGFVMETFAHAKMKEGGLDAPYVFEKQENIWWFSLDFAPVQQFLLQAQYLFSINLLPSSERDMVLRNAMAQKEAQARFDTSRLVDFSEEIFLDCPAAQVTPLVREPGRLVVTQTRLYFQPLHNLNNDSPVRSHPLNAVVAVARRRHALRHTGLEIFFRELDVISKSGSGGGLAEGGNVFFTFGTVEQRDVAVNELLKRLGEQAGVTTAVGSLLEADSSWLERVTRAWQEGLMTNFDYLIYLNLAAGRSFCDLTQWPVMPWILKDYTSQTLDLKDPQSFRDLCKPIGALNLERLSVFRERYAQMLEAGGTDPPFLYGTHYSAPGYVLYWLVRAAPAQMLRLQNGRFDAPDRLFVSMLESWESVLNNPADLKELIPEFFSPPADFLLIREGLNLGVRQNGQSVGNVQLPPWAKNSDEFIRKHREALESEYVSKNLHLWIDLIFGFKQRGEAALASDNLFHYLTYEGSVDLEKIDDPIQRAGLEAQINEFGQAPRQLFTQPHPERFPRRMKTVKIVRGSDHILCKKVFGGLNPEFLSRIMMIVSTQDSRFDRLVDSAEVRYPLSPFGGGDLSSKSFRGLNRMMSISEVSPVHHSSENNQHSEGSAFDQTELEQEEKSYLRLASSKSDFSIWDNLSPASTSGFDFSDNYWKMNKDVSDMLDNSQLSELLTRRLGSGATSILPGALSSQSVGQEDDNTSIKQRDLEKKIEQGSHPWHWMFRQRLSEPQSLKIHRGSVHAVILSEENASESLTMYSVGQDGFIKVYSIAEGFQIRATKLGNLPLSSLALARSSDAYPIALAGSYDDCLYAYSVDYGRALGKMQVHEETVSCVRVIEGSVQRLITASWDATVKIWSIEEGRGGWSGCLANSGLKRDAVWEPEAEFLEHDGAILSLDVEQDGHLVVSGAEDGAVLAWDLRNPCSSLWRQCEAINGPATGIRLLADGTQVIVASGEGSLHVLETRKSGALFASNECKTPLRCCEFAGQVIVAGSVDGALHFWPLNLLTEDNGGDKDGATHFLDFSPIQDHSEAINNISISSSKSGTSASLATASDDGSVQLYTVGH